MITILTFLLVILAGTSLFALRPVVSKIKATFNQNSVVDYQIKFQSLQLVLATITLILVYLLQPTRTLHISSA
ncbi:MAG: hypothetical protein U0Z26_13405 [Anaerolineales bacterium]